MQTQLLFFNYCKSNFTQEGTNAKAESFQNHRGGWSFHTWAIAANVASSLFEEV
ncbi:hypothetical protein [Fischerella sp. PCC 9605]|uniref:hypothetical protein n=1 Tax=Fischerella sp. PCC 9605 TaxID=1173024 RepID=UPI0004B7889D|nr:hypothetical protein [Fischerella sp. PCC 9605]